MKREREREHERMLSLLAISMMCALLWRKLIGQCFKCSAKENAVEIAMRWREKNGHHINICLFVCLFGLFCCYTMVHLHIVLLLLLFAAAAVAANAVVIVIVIFAAIAFSTDHTVPKC